MLILFILLSACGGRFANTSAPWHDTASVDTLYTLNILQNRVSQSLAAAGENPSQIRFVEVEITRVDNPKEYPVSFSVFFQPANGDPELLGVFGLYPSTHPGTFIVSTQSKLRPTGQLILQLDIPEHFADGDTLSAEAKTMRLIRR